MRIMVGLLVIGLAGAAHAEERSWSLGASGVSRLDGGGGGGVGLSIQGLRRSGDNAFGLMLERTWLVSPAEADELDVRQIDALAVARLGAPLAFELDGGVAFYRGRVDIPESEGCFGCGAYSGSSVSPLLGLGVVWSHELGHGVALELGARLVVALVLSSKSDVHNFNPQPVTVQSSVGFSGAL